MRCPQFVGIIVLYTFLSSFDHAHSVLIKRELSSFQGSYVHFDVYICS